MPRTTTQKRKVTLAELERSVWRRFHDLPATNRALAMVARVQA